MDEALAFCRRRFETASEHAGDLAHALTILRDDDAEAEQTWADGNALELRRRDLDPHRVAAARQNTALRTAIEAGRSVLVSLEEAARAETKAVAAVATARAAVQSAVAATADGRRAIDAAHRSIQDAEGACANARRMLEGL